MVGLEQSLQEIQAARSKPRGLLRLGAPTAFGESVLPRYMAAYRKRYSEVCFHLELGHPSILLPAVRQGKLDFAFADIFTPQDLDTTGKGGLHFRPVVAERLILVCSTDYYIDRVRNKKIPDVFQQLTFVAYNSFAPALHNWMKHYFDGFSLKPEIVLSVESVRAVITAIEHHLGLGVVPAHLVQKALDRTMLTCIDLDGKTMINHIAVVQLANKIPTTTEKSFILHVEKLWQMESEKRD